MSNREESIDQRERELSRKEADLDLMRRARELKARKAALQMCELELEEKGIAPEEAAPVQQTLAERMAEFDFAVFNHEERELLEAFVAVAESATVNTITYDRMTCAVHTGPGRPFLVYSTIPCQMFSVPAAAVTYVHTQMKKNAVPHSMQGNAYTYGGGNFIMCRAPPQPPSVANNGRINIKNYRGKYSMPVNPFIITTLTSTPLATWTASKTLLKAPSQYFI